MDPQTQPQLSKQPVAEALASQTAPAPAPANKLKAVGILVGAAILMSGVMSLMPSSTSGSTPMNQLTARQLESGLSIAQLQENRSLLEKNGLSKNFLVRDYADIDDDKVIINGGGVVHLVAAPIPLTGEPGSLVMRAGAGESGCVTIEVIDTDKPMGEGTYDLCLQDGDPIKTYIRD